MEEMVSTPWPILDDWAATDTVWNSTTDLIPEFLNHTVLNGTASVTMARGKPPWVRALITMVYLIGAGGNTAALCFLLGFRPPRNAKHSLLMVSLASNDLLAVIGMWFQMELKHYWPGSEKTHAACLARVIWRVFGLGSGSIVIVMAVERYLALTRPFFYQKYVRVSTLKKSILLLWAIVLLLVCLPIMGFGIYYKDGTCYRYKQAHTPVDRAYAYLYLAYGSLLCGCMVWCNMAVMRSLVRTGTVVERRAVLVRRISRNRDLSGTSSTEELAFARVMGLLCSLFAICWIPQMITIPLAQILPKAKITTIFLMIADILMALHFAIDPYFYVLQRLPLLRTLFCRKPKCKVFRNNSTKTTNELFSL